MVIQWYPGHMAKAKRAVQENLALVDMAVEVLDARAPMATRNPDIDALIGTKPRLVLLNKADLAEDAVTRAWAEDFARRGVQALPFVATGKAKRREMIAAIEHGTREVVQRKKEKGVTKTVRVMLLGIPNVGKSAIINHIAGGASANVADRPGVTRGKQWIRVSSYLELLDMPGLLWPKFDDEQAAKRLAFIGSINDEVLNIEAIAEELLGELLQKCPDAVAARYKLLTPDTAPDERLEAVCRSRGFLMAGGVYDTLRAARIVLDEFREGRIGRFSLETP